MRRILTCLLAICLAAMLAVPVFAVHTTDLVIRFEDGTVGLPGVSFEIYQVGGLADGEEYVLTGSFAGYPVDIRNASQEAGAAAALYAFAKKDQLTPLAVLETDSMGTAVAENLEAGLYLVGGLPKVVNGFLYHTEPQLIALPQADPVTGEMLNNPVLRIKYSKEPDTQQPISRKVLKIWEDVSGYRRPDTITVHLLKNGSVYSTVTLNEQNQWRHTWDGLASDVLWQITEEVPEGYTVTVEQEGSTFLLTNSAPEFPPPATEPPDDTDPEDKIPQTGMVLWPVVMLAVLGIVCIGMGIYLRKDPEYEA